MPFWYTQGRLRIEHRRAREHLILVKTMLKKRKNKITSQWRQKSTIVNADVPDRSKTLQGDIFVLTIDFI